MPMSGRFLLDTNIVIALLEGEAVIQDQLAQADEVFVSSIALGELFFGAGKSGRPQANRARVDEFARDNVVMGCDTDTARRYGEVKNALRLRGYEQMRSIGALRRPPGTHFLCKKPVPGPSAKNSNSLAVYQRWMHILLATRPTRARFQFR